jgi:hypothetical protein
MMTQKDFNKLMLGPACKIHGYTYENLSMLLFPSSWTKPHEMEEWMIGLLRFMQTHPEDDGTGWRSHLMRKFPGLAASSQAEYHTVYTALNEAAAALQRRSLQAPLPLAFRRFLRE